MSDITTASVRRSIWHGWGDPAARHALPPSGLSRLAQEIGALPDAPSGGPVAEQDVRLPEPALPGEVLEALRAVVGANGVLQDRRSRLEHAGGKSYPDLYRLRTGDGSRAPDAVVVPADAEQVGGVIRCCAERGVAVIPFGGGTSVVGGVTPSAKRGPTVSLDLRRLDRLVRVDPISHTATLQAGVRGPDIERLLAAHGLSLGHLPQSHQQATFGGYVATRSAGQASTGYGRIDDNVLAATVVTPVGELVLDHRAPASAAGPGLLDLVVGSEGSLGVITEATVKVHAKPTEFTCAAYAFASMDEAAETLRVMIQSLGKATMPQVCRISDPDETDVSLALAGPAGEALARYLRLRRMATPCLAVLVWEGTNATVVRARRRACTNVLTASRAVRLPGRIAQAWRQGRFSGPYLRDELMDRQVFVETLETATSWSNVPHLYDAVGAAIRSALAELGTPGLVQCHVSHVYETGCSLYFTFVAREAADPLGQWSRVKAAASEVIVAAGGTITHHHAVGKDHRPYLEAETGVLGTRLLRAVKQTLDPQGVMNPGTLVADD
ncbi:FAD-binding oxidoreductase [Luteipulveratus flavus]|uniref:FAD-binding oxidoreductase n=1 Tax=Luteipulveratus flavus TaxID=3031728 RepID=A0ABT6CB13_9MICO|nr:FAD-binding oxidoreductase [Luteipulveratus sp. YIM 133296]MDF8266085.1 FAD-binding oxidoreductase [Luteipulveratus sp. YIM 133296]